MALIFQGLSYTSLPSQIHDPLLPTHIQTALIALADYYPTVESFPSWLKNLLDYPPITVEDWQQLERNVRQALRKQRQA